MHPLNTTVSPRWGSCIGWWANGEGSMISRRRWPSATGPDAHTPQSSGPLGRSASVILDTAATSALAPSHRTSPAIPHTSGSLGERLDPRPGAAHGRGDDHPGDGSQVGGNPRRSSLVLGTVAIPEEALDQGLELRQVAEL